MSDFSDILRTTVLQFGDKNALYEKRVARALLQATGLDGMQVSTLARNVGEEFGLRWFNTEMGPQNFAISSVKLKASVSFDRLIRGNMAKSELWSAYEAAVQNWSNRSSIALVFDHHGDGIPDLVMHNEQALLGDREWYMSFWVDDNGPFYLHTFKSFLVQFGDRNGG